MKNGVIIMHHLPWRSLEEVLALYLTSADDMQSFLSVNSKRPSESHYFFHGRGLYHIETSALAGFCMIGIFIMK